MAKNNRVKIKIESDNLRPINLLFLHKINCYNVSRDDDSITFYVDAKYRMDTIKVLSNLQVDFVILKDSRINAIKHTIKDRSGLIIGFVLSLILMIILQNTILSIDIVGNDRVKDSSIREVLQSVGVRENSLKKTSTKVMQDTLIKNCKDLSFVTCHYSGTKLIVEVKEELRPPICVKNAEGCVIANYDGIITRIIVREGTAKVKEGDSVRKGDVLIENTKVVDDKVLPSNADGEIYAKVYLEEQVVICDMNVFLRETGRQKTYRFFGKPKVKSPYKHYTLKKSKSSLFGLLPIKYTTYTFVEREEVVVMGDNPNYTKYLLNCASERLKSRLFEGEKPEREWIFEKRLDNMRIISVYYEVEKLISGGKLE